MHISNDFIILFGPVMSWWCFLFECLIGVLQKIKTNDTVGSKLTVMPFCHCQSSQSCGAGPLEQTILQSHTRAMNICWWLKQYNCPEAIWQFKLVFNWVFSQKACPVRDDWHEHLGEVENVVHNGVHYFQAATHLGNSLISYYPLQSSSVPVIGSIQKITANGQDAWMTVKWHTPLPPNTYDPFKHYPHACTLQQHYLMKITFQSIQLSAMLPISIFHQTMQ